MPAPVPPSEPFVVAALYRFADFPDPAAMRARLLSLCESEGVRGTLLLAREGINGTIAGSSEGIAQVIASIRALPDCYDLDVKYAQADAMPFGRMKVRVKREIVTMGQAGLDPARQAGTYVDPVDWNALIADPDTIVIDTRNSYEVAIGSFAGAIDPGTASFSAFPAWFDTFATDLAAQGRMPKVAMFCTGGIRCEKATAYARARGVEDVYHLRGGILRYLEDMPEADSLWHGDCFVFDERVAVGHGLRPGTHVLCRLCGAAVHPGAGHMCSPQG